MLKLDRGVTYLLAFIWGASLLDSIVSAETTFGDELIQLLECIRIAARTNSVSNVTPLRTVC